MDKNRGFYSLGLRFSSLKKAIAHLDMLRNGFAITGFFERRAENWQRVLIIPLGANVRYAEYFGLNSENERAV